jgi:hypothetical protein
MVVAPTLGSSAYGATHEVLIVGEAVADAVDAATMPTAATTHPAPSAAATRVAPAEKCFHCMIVPYYVLSHEPVGARGTAVS